MFRLNWGSQRYHPLTGHGFSGGLSDTILGTETANLIGYWPLNETPASQEYLTFNGTSTNVNFASGASLDDIQDGVLYVDFWWNPTAITGTQIFFNKYNGTAGWNITHTNGILAARIKCATTDAVSTTSSAVLANGTWYHIVVYFDDAGDRKLYFAINGTWASYSGQTAGIDAIVSDAALSMYFGFYGNLHPKGKLAWGRISNTARQTPGGGNFTPPARTTIPTVDANTVGLWPLNEGYGSVAGDLSANGNDGTITNGDWGAYPAAVNLVTSARNGAYTGVTLGQSVSPFVAPLYDGANDYTDIYSASLNTAFDPNLFTVIIFGKRPGWGEAAYETMFYLQADANNRVRILKSINANTLDFLHTSGSVTVQVSRASTTTTNWFMAGITVSDSANEMKAYYNGAQTGATQGPVGTWVGALNATTTIIGAGTTTPTLVWKNGYLAHMAVWSKALTPAQILDIYQASGVV